MSKRLAALLLTALPVAAFAHTGHGDHGFMDGFAHPILGLDHLLAMLMVGVWSVLHSKTAPQVWLAPTAFVALLASRLQANGYLHCATDWHDYAQQMLAVLADEPTLSNTAVDFAPRPAYRPLTKFEQRGLRLGHGVWDLIFRRRESFEAEADR